MTVTFHNAPLVTKTVRTTAAVATELLRWTPELDSASIVRLIVTGTATSGDVVSVVRTWSVKRSDAGTVVAALSAEKRKDSGSGTWVVNLTDSGTDAVCSVTGEAGHDVTWTGVAVALNGSREIVRYWAEKSTNLESGEYGDAGDVCDFDIANPFSVVAWIKTTSVTCAFVGKHPGGGGGGWFLGAQSQGKPYISLDDDAGNYIDRTASTGGSTPNVCDGSWHCIAGTYSALTQTEADLATYVDGSEPASATSADTLTGSSVSASSLTLGRGSGTPFIGKMCCVSIYNYKLSAAEVAWIYNGGKPRNPADVGAPAAPVGHWPMGTDDTYPTCRDVSASGFDATLTGTEGDEFVEDAP